LNSTAILLNPTCNIAGHLSLRHSMTAKFEGEPQTEAPLE
jgi:hypothetical protein